MSGDRNTPQGPGREDLRDRLVTVAREILEHEGLEALTLRAAARAAGVSHMAPYRHFENKDDLLAAVATQGFNGLTHALDTKTIKKLGSPQAKRDTVGLAYVIFAISNPALYRLMFGANLPNRSRFPGLVDAGQKVFQRCIDAVETEPVGDKGHGSPRRRATAFWAMVHGLSCLAIDDLITLPAEKDGALADEVRDVLKAAAFAAKP